MDNNQFSGQPNAGLTYLLVSAFTSLFAWLNLDFDVVLSTVAKIVSVLAAVMAIRHYYIQNPVRFFRRPVSKLKIKKHHNERVN